MVAFELARHLETVNLPDDAVKWYAISWQRFRRGDWKTKAEEGVARLGGTLPAAGEVLPVPEVPPSAATDSSAAEDSSEAAESGGAPLDSQSSDASASDADSSEAAPTSTDAAVPKHARRRGRRGGRNRRKSPASSSERQRFVIQLSQPSLLQWKSRRRASWTAAPFRVSPSNLPLKAPALV